MKTFLIQYASTEVEANSYGDAAKKAEKIKPVVAAIHLTVPIETESKDTP